MPPLYPKRIVKDIDILSRNKDELQARGIYWCLKEDNMQEIDVLIVPREKFSENLVSPYTYGFFLFKVLLHDEFPMSPPNVTFYPKDTTYRLHPNYYTSGKVCLSMINTWSGNDWSPSCSILSLINVLEERFNENALLFEPGVARNETKMKNYNNTVEHVKYIVCIINVFNNPIFDVFRVEIKNEFNKNKGWLINRINELKAKSNVDCISLIQDFYYTGRILQFNYDKALENLNRIS